MPSSPSPSSTLPTPTAASTITTDPPEASTSLSPLPTSPCAASPYLNNAGVVFPYTITSTDNTLLHQGLRAVAREIVPGWATLLPAHPTSVPPSSDDLIVTVISGGITNLLYRLSLSPSLLFTSSASTLTPRDVIVRVYGCNTEVIIDREKENKLFAALSYLGFAPTYWGRFGNGRIEGWLDARPLEPEELAMTGRRGGRERGTEGQEEEEGCVDFVGMIARELARMHGLPVRMEGGKEEGRERGRAVMWEKMQEWACLAKDISFLDGEKGRAKQAQLEAIGLEKLQEEMDWLKGRLLGEGGREGGRETARRFLMEIVFSHQDLLCGNILYNPEWKMKGGGEAGEEEGGRSTPSSTNSALAAGRGQGDGHAAASSAVGTSRKGQGQERGRVQFIDFEYGGWNHRGFDIGNHFCEYAGFDPDYERSYPNQEQQEWFLKAYIEEWRRRVGEDEGGEEQGRGGGKDEGEEEFLEGLYVWVNRYACAAHLFWGYWAVIQARYSPIKFDFLNYASQRLAGYEMFKKKYF